MPDKTKNKKEFDIADFITLKVINFSLGETNEGYCIRIIQTKEAISVNTDAYIMIDDYNFKISEDTYKILFNNPPEIN